LPKLTKRQLAASSEVSAAGYSKTSQVPASAPTTPQTQRIRVIGSKEVNVKLELAKLYKRALEVTMKEPSVSSKKLQRELLVNNKLADELIQKLLKDKCLKDPGAKNRGKDVDREKTQKVLEAVESAISELKNSDSVPTTPKGTLRISELFVISLVTRSETQTRRRMHGRLEEIFQSSRRHSLQRGQNININIRLRRIDQCLSTTFYS